MIGPALITLEGIDGSGKSSQVPRIAEWLRAHGVAPVVVREPGGTPLGEALREVLLHDARGRDMAAATEVLLMAAARCELVERVIRPALERGLVVVSDRFADSTRAYQGDGCGVDGDWIAAVHRGFLGGLRPDLTLLFDLPASEALVRAAAGDQADHIGGRGYAFLERVRAGYLRLATAEPERVRVIDATRPPAEVWDQVEACLQAFLAGREEGRAP